MTLYRRASRLVLAAKSAALALPFSYFGVVAWVAGAFTVCTLVWVYTWKIAYPSGYRQALDDIKCAENNDEVYRGQCRAWDALAAGGKSTSFFDAWDSECAPPLRIVVAAALAWLAFALI